MFDPSQLSHIIAPSLNHTKGAQIPDPEPAQSAPDQGPEDDFASGS